MRARASQISLSLCTRLCALPAASRPPAFALLGVGAGAGNVPAAACRAAEGSRAAVKAEARSAGHSQKHRPEEIWGVIEEKEAGGGDSFPLSSVWLHHFLIRHKIVFIHWYCGLHKQSLWFIRPPLWGGLLKIERTGAAEAWSPGGPALSSPGRRWMASVTQMMTRDY